MSHGVIAIKEGMGCDEHWVFEATDQGKRTRTDTSDVLYVGYLDLNYNNTYLREVFLSMTGQCWKNKIKKILLLITKSLYCYITYICKL